MKESVSVDLGHVEDEERAFVLYGRKLTAEKGGPLRLWLVPNDYESPCVPTTSTLPIIPKD